MSMLIKIISNTTNYSNNEITINNYRKRLSNKINLFGLPEIRMKNKLVYEKKKASKL